MSSENDINTYEFIAKAIKTKGLSRIIRSQKVIEDTIEELENALEGKQLVSASFVLEVLQRIKKEASYDK